MENEIAAALIGLGSALVAAVLTATYTVGGRSALQRRTIKQELEIASAIHDGPAKRALLRIVDERVAQYVLRFSEGVGETAKRRGDRLWRPITLTLALWFALMYLPPILPDDMPDPYVLLVYGGLLLGWVFVGGWLGVWAGIGIRSALVSKRQARAEEAAAALERREHPRG